MKTIPLTRGKVALVSSDDYECLADHKWHATKSSSGTWYAYTNVRKPSGGYKRVPMHQMVLGRREGCEPDHINGDGLDNRRSNLRFCTHQQNMWNQKARGGSSQYRGVTHDASGGSWRKPWRATLHSNRVGILRLGRFATEAEAALAYDKKAAEVFGEFARLNFPDGPVTVAPSAPVRINETCVVCGALFEAKRLNRAKYCSPRCRSRRASPDYLRSAVLALEGA